MSRFVQVKPAWVWLFGNWRVIGYKATILTGAPKSYWPGSAIHGGWRPTVKWAAKAGKRHLKRLDKTEARQKKREQKAAQVNALLAERGGQC